MNEQKQITAKKTGLGNPFSLFLIIPFACIVIALVILVLGLMQLFYDTTYPIYIDTFIAYDLCLLMFILAILTRMYYKMFKRD